MLSIPHIIVIFVVALVVFGPEKLPELARNLGKVMAEFRRHTSDLRTTFEGHLRDLEREADSRKIGGPALVTAAKPASVQPIDQPGHQAPDPVPSNPPNAAAIAAGSTAPSSPGESSAAPVRKHPGDDPFLQSLDFTEPVSPAPPAPSDASETKAPDRANDGDTRPA